MSILIFAFLVFCLCFRVFPSFNFRKKIGVIKLSRAGNSESESNTKKAKLFAARKERIKLPNYGDDCGTKRFHISEFLSHPSGIEAMLNTSALESFQPLGTNTYRSFHHTLTNVYALIII